MNSVTVIKVSNLTKDYEDIRAVDHISFDIKKGEIFGFLGPNGAGKTSTIRMLTGLSKPTDGNASIMGYDINSDIIKIKKYLGVVPEISNLYDELSGLNNLIFMAQLYGVPRNERTKRAEELLKIFGLFERKDSLFRTYSRGMKRSLTIAAALIHNPEILFLDEPTVGLDVMTARSLRNLIKNLQSQSITIFLTTHYLEEADILCDRIAIIVKGKIIKTDSPLNIKSSIEQESVIEFVFDKDISGFIKKLSENLSEVKITATDFDKIKILGGNPNDIFIRVGNFVKENNFKIRSINSIKPSLEDAFVKITGLSPTIMAIEKGKK